MFFLSLNTVRSKKQMDALIYILILIGLFEAVYGIFQVFSDTPKVWCWKGKRHLYRLGSLCRLFGDPHSPDSRFHAGPEEAVKACGGSIGKAANSRLFITRTIVPMLWDYPALYVGCGNFRYLYPRYIQYYDRVSGCGYAHNDWVEAGTETGFPGLILILSAFAIYIVKMIRIWRLGRDFHALVIGAGVLAGLLSFGMHSYKYFSSFYCIGVICLPCGIFTL